MKERSRQQNALARLIFCANLGLARKEGRQKLACIIHPPRRLRTQREHYAVVAVECKVLHRVEGDRELRQPDGSIGEVGQSWNGVDWIAQQVVGSRARISRRSR